MKPCRCDEPAENMQNPDTTPPPAPTPIDPADIRPNDRFRVTAEYTALTSIQPQTGFLVAIHPGGGTVPLNPETGTWHLVHRPDPDAEAVEAIRSAIPLVTDGYAKSSDGRGAHALLTALREQGWDVTRRPS